MLRKSLLMRKAYFEVYYLTITCTDSLTNNSFTHSTHDKTGIQPKFREIDCSA